MRLHGSEAQVMPMKLDMIPDDMDQMMIWYCVPCAREAEARAEIEAEAEMERRVERAFEQRRW